MTDSYGPIRLSDILGNTAPCARCGALCRVTGKKPTEEARIARYATQETINNGTAMCIACVLSDWLQSGPLAEMITIEKLRDPRVQQRTIDLYNDKHGHNDGNATEINWDALIANWDLPFPKAKRRRKPKDGAR